MDRWSDCGAGDLSPCLGGVNQPRSHSRVAGTIVWRIDYVISDPAGICETGSRLHPPHNCDRPDVDVSSAYPPVRWTHRNSLPCIWIARLPCFLSRLAGVHPRHHRRRARPLCSRSVLAAICVRRACGQPLALDRTCRLGHFRRCFSHLGLRPRRTRDAGQLRQTG